MPNITLLEFSDSEIRDKRATLAIDGTKEFAVVTRLRGVPYHYHSDSRCCGLYTITDEIQLKDCLATALAPNFDRHAARSAGMRFLNAIVTCSYDLRAFDTMRRRSPMLRSHWSEASRFD